MTSPETKISGGAQNGHPDNVTSAASLIGRRVQAPWPNPLKETGTDKTPQATSSINAEEQRHSAPTDVAAKAANLDEIHFWNDLNHRTTTGRQTAMGGSTPPTLHSKNSTESWSQIAQIPNFNDAIVENHKTITNLKQATVQSDHRNERISAVCIAKTAFSAEIPIEDWAELSTLPAAASKKEKSTLLATGEGRAFTDRKGRELTASVSEFPVTLAGSPSIHVLTTSETVHPKGGHSNLQVQIDTEGVFRALDSRAIDDGGIRVAHRGGRIQAEAGFKDPSLGWIGVRAESTGSALRATIVSPSSEAAEALSGHMAGLHAYLSESSTTVEKLTLASVTDFGSQPAGQDSKQNTQGGAGQNAGHSDRSQPGQDISPHPRIIAPSSINAPFDNVSPVRSFGSSSGTHISVMV